MNRLLIHNKLYVVLSVLVAFTLPFASKITPILIGLLVANWLFEGDLKQKVSNIITNKYSLNFIALFVIHAIGLLYTSDFESGMFDLEVKLSILIFPIIIAAKPYSKRIVSYIMSAFILGLIYTSLYMLSRSISLYFIYGENTFTYQNFTTFIHPSYLSMYMNFTICWLLLGAFRGNDKIKFLTIKVKIAFIVFLSFMVLLIASKSGILTLLLIYAGMIIYLIVFHKKVMLGIASLVLIIAILFSINYFMPKVGDRVNNFIEAMVNKSESETVNSTSVRFLIWESSNQVIKNNLLFGVGTGDVKEELNKEYKKGGVTNAIEHNLNAHSEFYQVLIALGLVGFLILLMNLFIPLSMAFRKKDYLYILFLLIIIINFFSESMLETKAGVMFYAFINSVLCFRKSKKENIQQIN